MPLWLVNTPTPAPSRWGRFCFQGLLQRFARGSFLFSGVRAMPVIDYSKLLTFADSVEAVSITLHHALINLRDHVAFSENDDPSTRHAAEHLSALLEDARHDVEQLIAKMERGVNETRQQ